VLFQMVAGRLPFLPARPPQGVANVGAWYWHALRQAHQQAAPPSVDSPLTPLIERCLRKRPAERYQRFAELRAALEKLYVAQTGQPAPPPPAVEETALDLSNR